MHWKSWSEFFSMGGYGLYVWGSYGVTFVLLVGEVLMLLKRKRSLVRRESAELASQQARFETSMQEVR
jgi:heme exporter protein D